MSPADLERLEARVLGLLGEGAPVRLEDLRRDFPNLEEADIRRVQTSTEILGSWLQDLGGGKHHDAPNESWLAPGDHIGGYVVLRRIPGGAMGQVYHAVQESLYPRKVALKVHRLGADSERELCRARREAEVASRLVHPHLAAVHDMGHDEERGLVFFSMQFVEGPDLREVLGASVVDRAGVRRLVTRLSEVAGALAELHARGYVHRDVKPENVLLRANAGRDGRSESAVLVDFGLVRAERALRGASALPAGTPGYAPPEADLPGGVTPAWDVYSLGILLYEALSGTPPLLDARGWFRRPSADDIGALRATRGVDADLAAIVAHATREDPRARYRDAGPLQADLERWLAGETVSVRRPPPHERLWRAARRRPRRAAFALLALALLGGAAYLAGIAAREMGDVRRGLAAVDRGEPARGWETLAAADPLLLRWLVRERPDLERDLLHGTQDAPATRVALAERERGRGAALELAAAYLERDGFATSGAPSHPDLEAFLLRSLAAQRPAERSQALRVVARLFFERPVDGPVPLMHVEPFRERLLDVLADPRVARDDLLHAICGLGGAGGTAELAPLVQRAEAALPASDLETVRLVLTACERILRRCGVGIDTTALGASDWEALERRLAALWRDLQGGMEELQPHSVRVLSWTECAVAWGLAHRRTGYRLRLVERFEEGLASEHLILRAALREPSHAEVRDLILASAERGPGRGIANWAPLAYWAHGLGMSCRYSGSESLRAEIEARLAGDPELVQAFASGLREGELDLERGLALKYLPDERSRLRHLVDPESEAGALDLVPGILPEDATARWSFHPLEQAGWAAGASGGGGTRWLLEHFEPPHLRLARSGAWFEGRFTVPDPPPPTAAGWDLVVDHLAASRPYLPFHGEVWIRIELDGVVLADRCRVSHVGAHELSLRIEPESLTPGEHVVRVTVVEVSTTYWLHEVRVERR